MKTVQASSVQWSVNVCSEIKVGVVTDPGYVKTFLMGYRHFMEAEDLIDRLLTRYPLSLYACVFVCPYHVHVICSLLPLTLPTFNVGLPEESTDEEKEYVEKWGVVVQLRYVCCCFCKGRCIFKITVFCN